MSGFLRILFFIPIFFYFNMMSPVQEGTLGTRPFVNEYVDIFHENLHIKIEENFEFATYNIEYHIEATQDGVEIPLLFYASEYYDDFNVTLDGEPIELQKIENLFDTVNEENFKNFSNLFESNRTNSDFDPIGDSSGLATLNLPDFLYFKTNISKGKHIIKVNYTATRWTVKDSWVKSYSFRYALSPAKYWKSFGTLDVTIDASDFKQPFSTNLNDQEFLDPITKLSFDSLPTDVLLIGYYPKINGFANLLIDLKPFNVSIFFTVLLIIYHFLRIKKYRRKHPKKGFSSIALFGAIIIPIAFVGIQILMHSIIEGLLGNSASGLGSYGALYQIILIPILIIVYLVFAFSLDWFLKRSIAKG